MPLCRSLGGDEARDAAGADAERDQRRRARRQLDRPAGVHGRARRRGRRSPRRLRIGAEVYHALKGVLHERGLSTAVGDEGGFAPDLPSSEAAIEAILEAAERAGHRDRVAIALDPATSEVYRDGVYRFEGREATAAERSTAFWAGLRRPLPDRLDRGRPRRGRLGRLGASSRASSATGSSSSATTSSSRTSSGSAAGSTRASATRSCVKVNQIGTLTETLDAIELAQRERLRRRHLAPLRRDRGHDDRRPRGRDGRGSDQDRRALPHGPRREVQPAAPDRGGARRPGRVSGLGRLPAGGTPVSLSPMAVDAAPDEDRGHDRARLVDGGGAACR